MSCNHVPGDEMEILVKEVSFKLDQRRGLGAEFWSSGSKEAKDSQEGNSKYIKETENPVIIQNSHWIGRLEEIIESMPIAL